ncbi:helix-turn-helix domain-containing protein [Microbacteriaceae bacterium 4G12]
MTELGQKLKEAREAKGLSLDELQDITKIQKRYLVSIEEGNYNVLPGDFYVRAFIKQYAEAVGLDPDAIVEEHSKEVPVTPTQETAELSRSKRTKEAVQNATSFRIMDHMPKILITVLVVAIAIGIWLIAQYLSKPQAGQTKKNSAVSEAQVEKAKNSPVDKKPEENKEEPKKEDKKQEAPQPPQPVEEMKFVETSGYTSTMEIRNNTTLSIEITAKGRAYVDIKNGAGKMFFSGILQAGQTQKQELYAEDVVRLNIGSAPNTDIKINGKALEYPQDPNNVDRQVIVIKNFGVQPQAQQQSSQ